MADDDVELLFDERRVLLPAAEAHELLGRCSHRRTIGAGELRHGLRAALGAPSGNRTVRVTESMREEIALDIEGIAEEHVLSEALRELKKLARTPIGD